VIENSDGDTGRFIHGAENPPVNRLACFYDGVDMRVMRIQRDMYRVGSDNGRDSMIFSAAELIALYDWVLLNYKTVEGDMQNENAYSVQDERSVSPDQESRL
jgi:hypothetical protein